MKTLYRQRGIMVLSAAMFFLLFSFTFVLVNNGIVNLIHQELDNAVRAAAIAGAEKLSNEAGNPLAGQLATDEALKLALMHQWLGRPIQANQIVITLGQCSSCIFLPGVAPYDAVRVDISPPFDDDGNPTGITAFFGRLEAPMLQKLNDQTTAVGAVTDKSVVLAEYRRGMCL